MIGLFDSGVGGLSVWREIVKLLPQQATLYLADSVHCPYGPRPAQEIRRFSLGIARFLVECGAGLIVAACNTASAAGLEALRAEMNVPVVGMEPAVKPASERTRTGHIGVLATRGTVNGNLFRHTTARYAAGVSVHVQEGQGLVELVEEGRADTPETEELLRTYLQPMLDAGVDQIALGCTHYAFLVPSIRRIAPATVSVIDPAAAVARRVREVLESEPVETDQARPATYHPAGGWRFFTTGRPERLAGTIGMLSGYTPPVEAVTWDATETRLTQAGLNSYDPAS